MMMMIMTMIMTMMTWQMMHWAQVNPIPTPAPRAPSPRNLILSKELFLTQVTIRENSPFLMRMHLVSFPFLFSLGDSIAVGVGETFRIYVKTKYDKGEK